MTFDTFEKGSFNYFKVQQCYMMNSRNVSFL